MSETNDEEINEIESDDVDDSTEKSAEKREKDQKILEKAKKRFNIAADAETQRRSDALDDLRFRAGDQWPEAIKNERNLDGRPSLTINRIPQFVHQITNEQRQNRPSIKISPCDSKADVETAKVIEGLVRNIQNVSKADVAYDSAFESAVTMGFGYFRVSVDYDDVMSFNQQILIKQIPNAFSVYLDPSANEPDGSDANWSFVFEDMDKDEYMVQYPDSEMSQMSDWSSIGDEYPGWIDKNTCRVAEYYCKDFETIEIFNTPDGIKKSDELSEEMRNLLRRAKRSRFTQVPTVRWYKINGIEILEESVFAAPWQPIVPVYGDRLNIDGEWILESIVRHAKDPQRMVNYWSSAETEAIALAPKAPYIAEEGQIPEEYENIWKNANRKNYAYLPYRAKSIDGHLVGAPQRNTYEPAINAITQARAQSIDDLKATTGIYDASLGNRSNENSGVAIARRNVQSQTANFHYVDNLSRAMRQAGRIIVALIPTIYDAPRTERILGEDGSEELIAINQIFKKGGQDVEHDLTVGKYDVVVETGPSFATKRQEAMAVLMDFMKAIPTLAPQIADLIAGTMDAPGAKELQERLRKLLAPGLIEDKDKKPLPPEIQAQIVQMQQMIEQLSQAANQQQDIIDNKRLELSSKEKIAAMDNETKIVIEQMKLQGSITKESMLQALQLDQVQENQKFQGSVGNEADVESQNLQEEVT